MDEMRVFEIDSSVGLTYTYDDPWGHEVRVPVAVLHSVFMVRKVGEVPFEEPWTGKIERRDIMADVRGRLFRKDPPFDIGSWTMFRPFGWASDHGFHARWGSKPLVWGESQTPIRIEEIP